VPAALLLACLTLLAASCSPANKCGGALYYDPENISCRPCPTGARFEAGTCICPDGAPFRNHRCVAPEPADAGAQPDAAVSEACQSYCDFVQNCLANNAFAQSVVPDVISTLQADCADTCAAVGGDGALAVCIAEGRDAAACAEDDTQTGLTGSIMLLAQCSREHVDDPLRPVICGGLQASSLVSSRIDFCN
jgi:Cys-rich protein (TIGR04453 family)